MVLYNISTWIYKFNYIIIKKKKKLLIYNKYFYDILYMNNTFHEKLNEHHLNLKSYLNIPKHRNDYENILIEMNDYVDGLMLSEVLNVDPNNITNSKLINTVQNITKMNQSKESLNKIMKYLDNN